MSALYNRMYCIIIPPPPPPPPPPQVGFKSRLWKPGIATQK